MKLIYDTGIKPLTLDQESSHVMWVGYWTL